jgi:DNA polymerase
MNKVTEMSKINEQVERCNNCELCKKIRKKVMGEGNLDTFIVFVGEAPGAEEDKKGQPFIGKAGRLLDNLFEKVELSRNDVYITNLVKCRPPNNRRPYRTEIEECNNYLEKELEVVRPSILSPMGNTAVRYFNEKFGLGSKSIGEIHGTRYKLSTSWGLIDMVPLYHPAAAIYRRNLFSELLDDLSLIIELREQSKRS